MTPRRHDERYRQLLALAHEGNAEAVAALLAFPLPLVRKVTGLLAAALLIYIVNLVRIISLFFALAYRPQWFDLLHGAIWQTLIILLVAAFFLIWTPPARHAHEPSA